MNAEDKSHLDAIMSSFEQKLAKSKDARTQRQSEEDAGPDGNRMIGEGEANLRIER